MRAFCLTFARGGYIKSRKKYLGENDMTKTKRNLVLIISLFFAIFTLCSVFAGVSFHTPQTVEATEITDTRAPGLYETGTTTFVKDGENDMTWKYLIDNGNITTTNNALEVVTKTLAGDLICDSVDGLTKLGGAFLNCSELTSIEMTNIDLSGVTNMYRMCSGCKKLKNIEFGKSNRTGDLKNVYQMFKDCSSLESLDLSGFNTKKVDNMQGVFAFCSSLKSINLSGFDTSGVTETMQGMFLGCSSLKSLDVSNFDISRVSTLWAMFGGVNLDVLDLRNWNFEWAIENGGVWGVIGINESYCREWIEGFGFSSAWQKANNNENISEELNEIVSSGGMGGTIVTRYKSAVAGKTGDELGQLGKKYLAGYILRQIYPIVDTTGHEEVEIIELLLNTRIGTIYAPASAYSEGAEAGNQIALPEGAQYVAKSADGSEEVELDSQVLYGYDDLEGMTAGMTLTAKTAEVENTGITLDTKTIIIACAIAGACVLAIIAVVLNKIYKTNKRKNRKF